MWKYGSLVASCAFLPGEMRGLSVSSTFLSWVLGREGGGPLACSFSVLVCTSAWLSLVAPQDVLHRMVAADLVAD